VIKVNIKKIKPQIFEGISIVNGLVGPWPLLHDSLRRSSAVGSTTTVASRYSDDEEEAYEYPRKLYVKPIKWRDAGVRELGKENMKHLSIIGYCT
jgi:hypothetical protein